MRTLLPCFLAVLMFGCNDQALSGFDPASTPPPEPVGGVEGIYLVEANPNEQPCGQFGTTKFTASQVVVTVEGTSIYADWGLATAPGVEAYTEPAGTLDGARFLLNWTYSQTASNGFTTDYTTRWHGDFSSNGLVSHLEQDILIEYGLAGSCALLWQVSGTQL